MPGLIAFLLFIIPAYWLLMLHVRLDEYRTDAGRAARRQARNRWAAWREQVRLANYRLEGQPLVHRYTMVLVALQLVVIIDLIVLAIAYP